MIVDSETVLWVLIGFGALLGAVGLWMAADIKRRDKRIERMEAEIRRQGLSLPGE